jgi:hypothetical protein
MLIGCQLGVVHNDWLAEESHRFGALMKDGPEVVARRVTFDDEVASEVKEL